jgi:ribosomal protein L31
MTHDDHIDWSLTTWEGNRMRQHREFLALPFREKIQAMEDLGEFAAKFDSNKSFRPATIVCACGNRIETRSTQEEIRVDVCRDCLPRQTSKASG